MFKFLKDKFKKAVESFTKNVEEEQSEESVQESDTSKEQIEEQDIGPAVDGPDRDIEEEIEKVTEEVALDKTKFPGETAEEVKQEVEDVLEEPVDTSDEELEEDVQEDIKDIDESLSDHEKKDEKIDEPVQEEKSEDESSKPVEESVEESNEESTEESVDELIEEPAEEPVEEPEEIPEPVKEEPKKKGFFSKIKDSVVDAVTKSSISEDQFNDLFWDLEMMLLENNVAVEVIDKIKGDLKANLVDQKVIRGSTAEVISNTLKNSIDSLFNAEIPDLIDEVKKKDGPLVIAFVGINGSGKTTTIAKIAHMLKENGITCCLAAADTFRAAAIQQLEEHANNLKLKMIKHDYGADPAAVAFDAIKYAKSKRIECVLIDTAGRLHSNTNLVDEMKKIMRVAQPDMKIFVGESITGNDCIEQAKKFNEAIWIDGIILSKADVDEKGGAAISVSFVTGKPILYLGTGQGYSDMKKFEPQDITGAIF